MKPFRFEYIKGRFSGLTKDDRERRAFDEMEKETDGYKDLRERLDECKGVGDGSGETRRSAAH